MQNFDFSLEERLIIAKSLKFFAIIIALIFYYYKTNDIKKVSILLFIGYLGAEAISIIETLLTSNLPITLKNIFSSGVRNSGGFLFVFIMFLFDKRNKNKIYYYAILSSIIGMLIIGKWHFLISADGVMVLLPQVYLA